MKNLKKRFPALAVSVVLSFSWAVSASAAVIADFAGIYAASEDFSKSSEETTLFQVSPTGKIFFLDQRAPELSSEIGALRLDGSDAIIDLNPDVIGKDWYARLKVKLGSLKLERDENGTITLRLNSLLDGNFFTSYRPLRVTPHQQRSLENGVRQELAGGRWVLVGKIEHIAKSGAEFEQAAPESNELRSGFSAWDLLGIDINRQPLTYVPLNSLEFCDRGVAIVNKGDFIAGFSVNPIDESLVIQRNLESYAHPEHLRVQRMSGSWLKLTEYWHGGQTYFYYRRVPSTQCDAIGSLRASIEDAAPPKTLVSEDLGQPVCIEPSTVRAVEAR
ncbi:MAG: hypothetical protein HY074_04810 [Deltaproteobacteria bacterium]|nr:hypothetical protein [Deltaproteobacteria bacterium]